MHIKNAWYVAAMSDEISADKPMGRTICSSPLYFGAINRAKSPLLKTFARTAALLCH